MQYLAFDSGRCIGVIERNGNIVENLVGKDYPKHYIKIIETYNYRSNFIPKCNQILYIADEGMVIDGRHITHIIPIYKKIKSYYINKGNENE